MANATYEGFFNSSFLDVITPIASIGLPSPDSSDPHVDDIWLDKLAEESADRKMAFFDENLDFLLTLRFEYDEDERPKSPPVHLLTFLAHLQITYEASYISSLPASQADLSDRPIVPVRTTSINRSQNKLTALAPAHPSIFPPHTPNPMPSTTDADRQYVQAQGTPLRTGVWGDGMEGEADKSEGFALLWSESESSWIAVFKMTVQVSFMTTKVPDPLLCLTVSATLREKPLAVTPTRRPLQTLIDAAGGLPAPAYASSPTRLNGEDDDDDDRIDITGLNEVNLLEGLAIAPSFSSSSAALNLPTTRLGASVRKDVFSLTNNFADPPTPHTANSSMTIGRSNTLLGSHATLRKSFRKTLRTVSGFRVRMRTVFVPYFMLPQNGARRPLNGNRRKSMLNLTAASKNYIDIDADSDAESDSELVHERELREAGNEEHTVILCIEVENAQDPASLPSPFGFSVESVNVTVSGEGAQTRLIAWGDAGLSEPERVFPLFLGPSEQYNLLYAVSFLRSPETDDQFSLARGRSLPGAPVTQDLQRAVAIVINGRPYEMPIDVEEVSANNAKNLLYPTPPFPSRWNCVLDLSSNVVSSSLLGNGKPDATPNAAGGKKEALPTPASPFPSSGPRTSFITSAGGRSISPYPGSLGQRPGTATPTMVAGSKRHTLGAIDSDLLNAHPEANRQKAPHSPVNYRSGTAMLNPANVRDTHLQTGTQENAINTAAAAAAAAQAANPILGPNSATMRSSYLPPSMAVQTYTKSPTTYGPLSPPLPPIPGMNMSFAGAMQHLGHHGAEDSISGFISTDSSSLPPTPAYPAYPSSPPPTSPTTKQPKYWQGPITNLQGSVGPTVEIKRERAGVPGVPQTPGPRVGPGVGVGIVGGGGMGDGGGFAQMQNEILNGQSAESEPIVVSVGLLPLPHRKSKPRTDREKPGSESGDGERDRDEIRTRGKIYPLDQFTLDIFVFNQSSWTRRFEVSCPDRRKRRRKQATLNASMGLLDLGNKAEDEVVGVVPLENRVRIGPLLPSTCQSVRMDFLALTPGVHAIDTLTLTDIQSGYTMDLRSVIDVVVHEHEIPRGLQPATSVE